MTSTEPPEEDLIRVLLAVSRAMVALSARNMAALGIEVTLPQYRTLVLLASDGPQRSATLARTLRVAPSTLTRMCDRLVRKALVHRFHRDDDRRTIWLGLTPAGKELVGVVMRARRGEIEEVVRDAGLSASAAALDLLHRFVKGCGELSDGEWWQRWTVSAEPVQDVFAPRAQRHPGGACA